MRQAILACACAIALGACSDWKPIKNAHDYEGQRVKVEVAHGDPTILESVVTCDDDGFVIANEAHDCADKHTFDTRRDKVSVHDGDAKSSVGLVVTGILAAIFVPVAIVGSAILTSH